MSSIHFFHDKAYWTHSVEEKGETIKAGRNGKVIWQLEGKRKEEVFISDVLKTVFQEFLRILETRLILKPKRLADKKKPLIGKPPNIHFSLSSFTSNSSTKWAHKKEGDKMTGVEDSRINEASGRSRIDK